MTEWFNIQDGVEKNDKGEIIVTPPYIVPPIIVGPRGDGGLYLCDESNYFILDHLGNKIMVG
jgi:hypothetical protein